jgi:hypothetical protein
METVVPVLLWEPVELEIDGKQTLMYVNPLNRSEIS